ncbi:MAG: hypothetical protein IPK82_28980 [Polyangiaceae bacterium]|nr:hypothetical protein [Polyangiaceae bacterium]
MSRRFWRWWGIATALTAASAVAACASYDPIVYTERVPYEWETWTPDGGTDGDAGPDSSASPGASAPPSSATSADPKGGAPPKTAERTVFPSDNFWNKDVSGDPVDPKGHKYLESIGLDTPLKADFSAPEPWTKGKPGFGIPFQYVAGDQKKVPVEFKWSKESDPGPYPIPDSPLIERGDDRHLIMVDKDNWLLYELFEARLDGGKWKAQSGAIFDLKSNKARPAGWTSADAAGLAIFPGLVKVDEVLKKKAITHALRFTVKSTQRAYVPPASHFASDKTDANLPPMGTWLRLKPNVAVDGFSQNIQVILNALKKHGMILADNGSNLFLSGEPSDLWLDAELKELKRIKCRDFEVVKTGELVTQ